MLECYSHPGWAGYGKEKAITRDHIKRIVQ